MTAARLRLLIAFVAFGVWVAWLGFQSLTETKDPVLSRAQLLVSKIDVIGTVNADADGKPLPLVVIQDVHWPREGGGLKTGDSITVADLPECTGFAQSGLYILPLIPGDKPGEYRVAGLPPSPGFDTFGHSPRFIYPVTRGTRKQLDTIEKR
jgi:hypothetical protein